MLEAMRQIHERVLVAKGYYLGKPLSASNLRVYQARDQLGSEFLFVRGKILGPSWPSIAKVLDESQIEYALIEAGNIWLVAPDSERVRHVLLAISKLAKHSNSEVVLVPEVGFVAAGIKKRLETRNLLGPVIVALLSMGLFIVPTLIPEQEALEQPKQVEISCALDLPADEFNKWVAESFEGRGTSNAAEVQVQSELGTLFLKIQQTLGSTQSVMGQVECEDGRSRKLHYRLDASASGNLIEIGQDLNP
jgi:hypothetical protein